jgi:hypothetical protein
MRIALEVIDDLLPVCRKDISVGAMKSLINLDTGSASRLLCKGERPTFAQAPV